MNPVLRWPTGRRARKTAMTMALVVPLAVGGGAVAATHTQAQAAETSASSFPGQKSGLLPAENLTIRSALQVDLTRETVRLPLFKATVKGETVWYVITEASDPGIAADLDVNHAAKLNNVGIGCATCVQTATVVAPTPEANRFGTAVIDRPGAPDFSPTRVLEPGPDGFPPAKAQPGALVTPTTARSSGWPARRSSTTHRLLPPATVRSTWSTTPTPRTAYWASTSRRPRGPASSISRGWTCCW